MAPKHIQEHCFQAREQEILDAAIALIDKHGFECLTMDKVVGAVPYSKGTVYKHFLGKEDLFLAISNQANKVMLDMMRRAVRYQGGTRERMLLISISYLVYAIIYPTLFKSVQCSKSPSVYNKSSEQRLQEQELTELMIRESIMGIVEDAEINSEMEIPEHMSSDQVCFSTWAVGFGVISLFSYDLDQCTGSEELVIEREMFNQYNLLLDGYQWKPLTKDENYELLLQAALKEVFPGELVLLKASGREFNFS